MFDLFKAWNYERQGLDISKMREEDKTKKKNKKRKSKALIITICVLHTLLMIFGFIIAIQNNILFLIIKNFILIAAGIAVIILQIIDTKITRVVAAGLIVLMLAGGFLITQPII